MSARNVYAAIDDAKYQVTPCLIDKQGHWWLQEEISDHHVGHPQLLPVFGQKKFITLPDHKIVQPDVIYPVLHGKWGEDGTIQGFAEMMNMPCVGPSVLGAALTMEKDTTKRLLQAAGILVTPAYTWNTDAPQPQYDDMVRRLGDTMFVKPSRAGSSVGVTKVKSANEWGPALDEAAKHDTIVLIEKAIDARELEVAVLGNTMPKAAGPGEIHTGEEFYSYDDKYAETTTSSVAIPADVDEATAQKVRELALRAYVATDGRGMARVDFFLDRQSGQLYLNEINSLPGFTNISMYPKLWQHEGLKYSQLVDRLIQLALE